MPTEIARAKINLNLHVGRVIDDPDHPHHGYHPLSSLVVFADRGDELSCEEADETSLEISGPFANELEADDDNLVLKAYDKTAEISELPQLEFHLVKNLPIASGIGGGSADAAAALRLLQNFVNLSEEEWHAIALSLGADVPVCLYSKSCIMSGIGEDVEFLNYDKELPAVLVNPGVAVSTGQIFQAFDQSDVLGDLSQSSGDMLTKAQAGRNDLQAIAALNAGIINDVLNELGAAGKSQLTRMSGSGATCFGLFETWSHAELVADTILQKFPNWWVQPVMLGNQP